MVDCSGFIEPLNLECLLINTFSGTLEIFVFAAIAFIAGLAAYFRMPNYITFAMIVLFSVVMYPYTSMIYSLVILLVGIVSFYSIAKLTK